MSKKIPPTFADGMPYKTWENKIHMLEIVASIPTEQDLIIVLLESLYSNMKAEKAISELDSKG